MAIVSRGFGGAAAPRKGLLSSGGHGARENNGENVQGGYLLSCPVSVRGQGFI